MKNQPKVKISAQNLCCCCQEDAHHFIPDRELNGYVCKDCSVQLKFAERKLIEAGFSKPQMGTA